MRTRDTLILQPPGINVTTTQTIQVTGLVQWRLACVLMTLDNIGGGVVSRSIVSVQVRGVNVYTVMSQSVAAGATLASHVFAVGLAHHSETVAGLSDLREMSLPSMTFDGGDEAIDGMIIVSNPGGAAILQVTSVVLDRLQYLARRDDGGARARARRGRAGEIK